MDLTLQESFQAFGMIAFMLTMAYVVYSTVKRDKNHKPHKH